MYFIDGHNLIGQMRDEIRLDDPNDEMKLVFKLYGFAARTNKKIVVVFDRGMPGGRSHHSHHMVEVVFAGSHTNADRVLAERIKLARDPAGCTVVTGDLQVREHAQFYGMRVLNSRDFVTELRPQPLPTKDDLDDDPPPKLRAPSHRPRLAAPMPKEPTMTKKDRKFFFDLFGVKDEK